MAADVPQCTGLGGLIHSFTLCSTKNRSFVASVFLFFITTH